MKNFGLKFIFLILGAMLCNIPIASAVSTLAVETYDDAAHSNIKGTYYIGETIYIEVCVSGKVNPGLEKYLHTEGRSDPTGGNIQEFRNQDIVPGAPVSGQCYDSTYTILSDDPTGTWRIWGYSTQNLGDDYTLAKSSDYKDITVAAASEFPFGLTISFLVSTLSYLALRNRVR